MTERYLANVYLYNRDEVCTVPYSTVVTVLVGMCSLRSARERS
jgi:hypothetical protein